MVRDRYRLAGKDRMRSGPGKGAGKAWLVYDGECPLCRNYALRLDVEEAVGELALVNAREGGPLVEQVRNLPYDLDEGMVLKLDGRFYRGSEALHALAGLSGRRSVPGLLNRLAFGLPGAARAGYPLLKLARRLALWWKGVGPING